MHSRRYNFGRDRDKAFARYAELLAAPAPVRANLTITTPEPGKYDVALLASSPEVASDALSAHKVRP